MRWSLVLCVVVLAAACSGGGLPATPASPTPAVPTFRLTGIIRDGSALAVVPGVTVSVVSGANAGKSAVTGAGGGYALTGLVRDALTLRTSNSDYQDHLQDIALTQDTVIDIRLVPRRTLNSGWSAGRLFFTANGEREMARLVSAATVHSGTDVTGTFSTAEGGGGTFSGQIDGTTFTGMLSADFSLISGAGRRCRGVARTATGLMTPDVIEIRAGVAAFENRGVEKPVKPSRRLLLVTAARRTRRTGAPPCQLSTRRCRPHCPQRQADSTPGR